ncbi:MAG: hypothetical protein EOO02_21965 [Chitinophagaceae bacterium]|nr:MAG: hypothetical protein EOO02_21965 [Chitinophagaceae bacterium]
MAQSANLILSDKELQLVSDETWIRMKDKILEKVAGIFGSLPSTIHDCMKNNIPDFDSYCTTSPKISRGERYKGLPYLILDYPREFGKQDVFAIRTMFWWAHYFSIHLQLAGKYRSIFEERLIRNISTYKADLRLCINEDPWQHDMEEENYISLSGKEDAEVAAMLQDHPFIKISLLIPFKDWNMLDVKLGEGYRKISGLFA